MSFPVVETLSVSDTIADANTHTIDTPAGVVSGDLLIAFICLENQTSPANQFSGWSDGFNEIKDKTSGGSSGASIGVAYKISDGTEGGSITVDSVDDEEGVHAMYRISNFDPLIAPEISIGASGDSDEPDPDELTPAGGVKDFLYMVLEGNQEGGGATIDTFPTDYDDNQINEVEGGGTSMGVATRELAANPEDPGIFGLSTDQEWQAFTLAVHPPPEPAAAISGTAEPTSTETQIAAGGRTILITLTEDTWVAAGGAFDAIRQDILDGLDSAQSEQYGWNAEVRDKAPVTDVVRTSGTLVTITLSAQPAFDITTDETITVTVPASAVTSAAPITATPTFTVGEVTPSSGTTGTILPSTDEDDIVAGGKTIILTLFNASYVDAGAPFDAIRQDIIDGLNSAQSEGTGWNAEVRDKLLVGAVVRTSQRVVTITLSAQAAYDITAQETIQPAVPASATNIGGPSNTEPTFDVDVGPVEITVTGTVEPDACESEIVAGGQTFIVTLKNDTWIDNPGFNATRGEIIDGFTSMQSEAAGWNAEVRDKMPDTDVVRTSDTVMTVTLSAQAGYQITVDEEIEITIPGAALEVTVGATVATPTFDILADATAELTGTIVPINIESQIVSGGRTLIITLENDTWVASGAAFNNQRQAIIDGCESAQSEATGWNAEVRDKQPVGSVIRTSDTEVTITWSASPLYEIVDNEVITVTVPAAALVDNVTPVVATPTFIIFEIPLALVTGTVQPDASEAEIVAGGQTIILTLIDDEWVAAGVEFDDIRQDIIQGLDSDVPELEAANGWNQLVRDNLPNNAVVRTSDTVVTITLIAFPTYATPRTETITVTVPAAALDQTPNDIQGIPTFQILLVPGSKARDRRGGAHAEDIFDVNTPNVETFPVNTFD